MATRYLLSAALCLACGLTVATAYAAPRGYSDAETVCIDTCRKASECFGGPGAHDGSARCRRCVAKCSSAQKK